MCPRISVLFCQAKVDNINKVSLLPKAPKHKTLISKNERSHIHQEIVRFDVSVDEVLAMDVLNPADELICQQ